MSKGLLSFMKSQQPMCLNWPRSIRILRFITSYPIRPVYKIFTMSRISALKCSKLKNEQGDLLSYLVKLPQLFRPGEGWSYSSTGYILMGYLMEKVTGLSFAELMKRYVLTPLSMTNTGLDLPRRINPGRAYGHAVENGQLVNAEQ